MRVYSVNVIMENFDISSIDKNVFNPLKSIFKDYGLIVGEPTHPYDGLLDYVSLKENIRTLHEFFCLIKTFFQIITL